MDTLDFTLRSLPEPDAWPMALPPAHLTTARWFGEIVDQGELRPRLCPIFNDKLTYFFYGGVFYRTSNKSTRNAAELPIAFLFDPKVLPSFFRYYPFDTGGLAQGLYGGLGSVLQPFEDTYAVSGEDATTPSRIVYHLYMTNRRYLEGTLNDNLGSAPIPVPQLSAFLQADLTELGIDKRQSVIECHSREPITLAQGLLWIGFPESMTDVFARLYDVTKPSMPEFYPYKSHVTFNPIEIAAVLENRAADVIKRFEDLPKAAKGM